MVDEAEVIIIAPVFFGEGNTGPLRTVLEAARQGKKVVVMDYPPAAERDLTDGEATDLLNRLIAAGAVVATDLTDAVAQLKESGDRPRP